jgi:hypothetical protein
VYEGIIRSISAGKHSLKEVADVMFSRGLVNSNGQTSVRPYVNTMEAMDLIVRVPYHDKNRNHYSVRSKIMELYYYLDEKYGPESDNPRLVKEVFRDRSPFHVQAFAGELLAQAMEGEFRYHAAPDHDIDIIITRRKRPVLVGEVKWSARVRGGDIQRFLDNTRNFDCRKVLITRKPARFDGVETLTPDDLLKMVQGGRKAGCVTPLKR